MKKKVRIVIIVLLCLLLLVFIGLFVVYNDKAVAILGYHNIYNSDDEQIKYNQFIIDVKRFIY